MRHFKKIIIVLTILLVIAFSAHSIDITPKNNITVAEPKDSYLTQENITPTKNDILPQETKISAEPTIPTEPQINNSVVTSAPSETQQIQELSKTIKKNTYPVTSRKKIVSSVILPDDEERIYYARSVTSNNPEYKTRFSILHNTPSPKRVAGERLYNISDSFFKLSVIGNTIKILDNPVLNLTGINSAAGRYGEIKFLDGAVFTIHGPSGNFKGNWDLDGTGNRQLKITPTNLVSGVIPVHIKTFKADGSIITDEKHDITFKALAMGPYNGYWSDGVDVGMFLWGMSNLKLQSKEMSYIGLDLGIVSHNIVTKKVIPSETVEETPSEPISPMIMPEEEYDNNGLPIIPFGEDGYSSMPRMNGFIPNVIFFGGRNTPPTDFCVTNPNDPRCKSFCEQYPNDPKCRDFCVTNPNDPRCKSFCERHPNDPKCRDFCKDNPHDPICCPKPPIDCSENPFAKGCENYCKENPTAHGCCILHPNRCHPVDICKQNPHAKECMENPDNPKPVSEPVIPFVFASSLIGYFIIRRYKRNNN